MVLCERAKRAALEERVMKVSREKTECMCLNGTPLGSGCNLTSCHRSPNSNIREARSSTLQSDGDMSTEINKRTQCGWNNWWKMSCVLCDKRVPSYVKGKIHTNDRSASDDVRDGESTND